VKIVLAENQHLSNAPSQMKADLDWFSCQKKGEKEAAAQLATSKDKRRAGIITTGVIRSFWFRFEICHE